MKKKILVMIAAAALCVGMLPSSVFADAGQQAEEPSVKVSVVRGETEGNFTAPINTEIESDDEDIGVSEEEPESDLIKNDVEAEITEEGEIPVDEDLAPNHSMDEALTPDAESEDEISLLSDMNGNGEEEDSEEENEIATYAQRTEYPDAGTPDIDDLEWGMNLSKSATELNEDYESTVTLSFQHDIDLVIVQDGTNLENETFSFLESLEEQENIHVNAGLVVFGGTTPISYSTGELLDLSDPEDMALLEWALTEGAWEDTAGHSGSNVQAGIREARNMLNKDGTHVASDKFIILMSDCAARMWIEGDDVNTAYAQARYISSTKQMKFDDNQEWIERYGMRISASHNVLGESSDYLFDYPTFQEVWDAGQGGANLDNYVMSYPEWLEKEAVGDLTGSICMTTGAEPNAVTLEDYYTNYETATWHAANEIVAAASEAHIDLISYAYYGYPLVQYSYGQYMDEFQEWIAELNNTKRYAYLESDPEGSGLLTSSRIFNHISEQIEETEIGGGVLIDEIGCTDEYDFDFIDEIDRLHLTAGGEVYDCTEIETEKGETSAYGFGDPDGSDDGTTYPFVLHYYADGYTYTDEYTGSADTYGECFVLEINTGISKYYTYDEESGVTNKGVSLTYDVVLTNPQTESGTYGTYDEYGQNNDGSADYGLYTNNQAYLYPRDRDGNPLPKQRFQKPTVSYSVDSDEDEEGGGELPPDQPVPTISQTPGDSSPSSPSTPESTTTNIVKTDDPNHIGRWVTLLVAAGALAVGGVAVQRRRPRAED